MNKLLSMALASALFATTGFASTGALTIAENGEVEIVGDTTANITSNAGTLDIAAGKTLTDTKIENSGIIKIRVNQGTYGHIQNETADTAYTIEQQGWNPEANKINNVAKGAAEGEVAFYKTGAEEPEGLEITCNIGSIENAHAAPQLTWSPDLKDIFGNDFVITATKTADGGADPVVYTLKGTDGTIALTSDKKTSGTQEQLYISSEYDLQKFFGRLNVTGLSFNVTDTCEALRSLIGNIENDTGEIKDVVWTYATPVTLEADQTLEAKVTGTAGLTFEGKDNTPHKITLNNDMSEYEGKLTTDGDLEIKSNKALPAGDMKIAGKLTINTLDASDKPLVLSGTAPVEAQGEDPAQPEKIHTVEAASIDLQKSFTVGAYGKLILGSND